MLLLTRKAGQAVRIGTDILVQVVETRKGQVKLMFEAPKEVPIIRSELLEQPSRTEDRIADEEDTGFFNLMSV